MKSGPIFEFSLQLLIRKMVIEKKPDFMKRKFLTATLLFCCSVAVFAGSGDEDKKLSYISIGTGYSQYNMIDRKVSPLVYHAGQSPNCLSFYQQSERSIFRADIDFVLSYLSPKDFSERWWLHSCLW